MLRVNDINKDKDRVIEGLIKRNYNNIGIIDQIIELDNKRKSLQTEADQYQSKINQTSRRIGQLFKEGRQEEAKLAKSEVSAYKESLKKHDTLQKDVLSQLEVALLSVPNIPHPSVIAGQSEDDNEVIRDWPHKLPELEEGALPHWELASQYKLIDFKAGVKITGSGFVLYRGKGARLERALINFFLDEATKAGFEEIMPPHLVNAVSAQATGNLPDKEGQMYHCVADDLYLIPTAEIPITNLYRDMIVREDVLPIKLAGYTPCFRREAGSYGADVKGLNRVHQFNKVEIVQIAHPDRSYQILDQMVEYVAGLLDKLELPYRILRLCGGDLGFTSALTFDFEIFSAAQRKWLEVSSVSNFETYQSNRLKLRFKERDGRNQLVHTLNGSALALARIMAGLLENNQTSQGIKIPEVLQPYTGFDIIK